MKIIYTYRKSIKKCQGRLRAAWQLFVRPHVCMVETSVLCVCCKCVQGKVNVCWLWRHVEKRVAVAVEGRVCCRTSLKAPSWILRRPLAASSSATSLQTSIMCLFELGKDSGRISIKSSVVRLMALSMEGQPIPLYTSAQLCVNHPSLILSLPSSSLLRLKLLSLSLSLSSSQ